MQRAIRHAFIVLSVLVAGIPNAHAGNSKAKPAAPAATAPAKTSDGTQDSGSRLEVLSGPREYHGCMALAKAKPEEGWEEALAWQSLGGGEAARHCAAVALVGLEKYGEAATRLETLANESVREDSIRAELFAQAGQAWILQGNMARAESAQRAGLTLSPDNTDILLDHAVLMADMGHYKEAVEDLSKVLRLQPNRVEALTLRASAYRYLKNIVAAGNDINQALALDPSFPDALLEQGMLYRLTGQNDAARQTWRKVIDLMPEGGPTADIARQNLEKMDIKSK